MAGDLRLTRLLLGMGFRSLSMPPAQLLEVKQAVLNSDLTRLKTATATILASLDADEIAQGIAQLNTL